MRWKIGSRLIKKLNQARKSVDALRRKFMIWFGSVTAAGAKVAALLGCRERITLNIDRSEERGTLAILSCSAIPVTSMFMLACPLTPDSEKNLLSRSVYIRNISK